jgi:hypothetical protein
MFGLPHFASVPGATNKCLGHQIEDITGASVKQWLKEQNTELYGQQAEKLAVF